MASQEKPTSNLFSISNLIWLLIFVGAIFLGFQLLGKKDAPATAATAGTATKNSTSKSATKNELGNHSFLQVPLGLYTKSQRSNDPHFMTGMRHYNKKEYAEARQVWNELPNTSTVGPDTLNYYLGGTYFSEQNYQKAISYFQKAAARPGTRLTLETNWYLAVSNNELRNSYLAMEYLKKVDEHPLKDQLLHYLQGVIPEK